MVGSIVLLVALAATPADRARDLYRAGSEAYRQGQYQVAINAFEEVLTIERRPAAIFSAAQAHRLQYFVDRGPEHLDRAVVLYREYLEAAPGGSRRNHAAQHLATLTPIYERERSNEDALEDSAPQARIIVAANVEEATARVDDGEPTPIPAGFIVEPGPHRVFVEAPGYESVTLDTVAVEEGVTALNPELSPTPGRVTVYAPEGARVGIDGRVVGRAPLAEPLAVSPGSHVLSVIDDGRDPFVRRLEVGSGSSAEVEVDLSLSTQRLGAWVALGVGTASLVTSVFTLRGALVAESDASELERRIAAGNATVDDGARYSERISDRDTSARATIALAAVGVVALGTAAFLWVSDDPDAAASTLVAGPAGAGVAF